VPRPDLDPDRPRSPRLLILDDEESILLPVASYFRAMGYGVVTAQEPEEALAVLGHQPVDLVILDLALPFGHEGLDVLQSLRADHPSLPVIVVSANVSPEVEEQALHLGAEVVLGKPQPMAYLAAVAGRLLGRTR
jgi:two-component system, OmpR family, alkaline phosphatase synthesis response regulator PhoP